MFKNLTIRTGLLILLAVFALLQFTSSGIGMYFLHQNDEDVNFLEVTAIHVMLSYACVRLLTARLSN